MSKEISKDVEVDISHEDDDDNDNDGDSGEEDEGENKDALLDGYPVDLEFHHAVHQRTETFRAFFRREFRSIDFPINFCTSIKSFPTTSS